jgi:hypothetical protein
MLRASDRGAERRAVDAGHGDGTDGRTLFVHEAERALVMADLAIGIARRDDDDAAFAIDERGEVCPLRERDARGVIEEIVEDQVALLVAKEGQARDQLC